MSKNVKNDVSKDSPISAAFADTLQTFEKPGDLHLLTDRSAAQSLNTNKRDRVVVGFEVWRSRSDH